RLLAQNAAARPDAFALRDGARRLSWAELLEWVEAAAADLAAQGLRANDRVSLWASNRVESVVMYLACSRNGYACNPSLHRPTQWRKWRACWNGSQRKRSWSRKVGVQMSPATIRSKP
ncbi:MAG: AMP-binding protein, partial [Rickettsiales bacterium]